MHTAHRHVTGDINDDSQRKFYIAHSLIFGVVDVGFDRKIEKFVPVCGFLTNPLRVNGDKVRSPTSREN